MSIWCLGYVYVGVHTYMCTCVSPRYIHIYRYVYIFNLPIIDAINIFIAFLSHTNR